MSISDLMRASDMGRRAELSERMRQLTAPPSYLAQWAETDRRLRELSMPSSALAEVPTTLDQSIFRLKLGAGLSSLADRQLQLAGALNPIMEAQNRMADMMGSHTSALQNAFASIPTTTFFLPGDLLQRLDGIGAASFLGNFQEPESIRALRLWTETLSSVALGFPDGAADAFANLVEDEFEDATAMVAADPGALEGMTVLDFLLALQNAWGALREYPLVRAALLMIVTALVQGGVQQLLSASDHAEVMAELHRQSALIEQQARAYPDVNQMKAGADSQLHGVAIRNTHIRAGPDVASQSLGTLTPGDVVLILGREGDWLRVMAGLPGGEIHSGWIYARLIKAVL